MIKSYKVRLEPNNKQNTLLLMFAGGSRWAFNWALTRIKENFEKTNKFIGQYDLEKKMTILKSESNYKWLNRYPRSVINTGIKDAVSAYVNYFKKNSSYPKYKSKKYKKQSFGERCNRIKFTESHVSLAKIGKVRMSESNVIPVNCKYYNPRVTFDGLYWYISVGIDVPHNRIELTNETIGIDVGIKDLAICSNDKVYKNINKSDKMKKIEKKLHRLQRKVSKKYNKNRDVGNCDKTNNIVKASSQVLKAYKRLTNIKMDYLHKVTTEIVKTKPSRIIMESISINGIIKNRHLSKAVMQQSLYMFKKMIQYKAEMYGIEFVEADRWYPSSKTCSECGFVKPKLSLSERVFKCECCGAVIDRDKNAAINLSRYKVS